MEIELVFDMEKAHLFDADTKQSIMGVPDVNRIPAKIEDGKLVLGKERFELPEKVKERLFDFTIRDLTEIRVPSNEVSLEETPDCISVRAKVDFVVKGSDCTAIYAKTDLTDGAFVFRVKDARIKAGDEITLYLPFSEITLHGADGLRLNSREKVSSNVAPCSVSTKEGVTTVKIGGASLSYPDLGVADGEYKIRLISDKLDFMYDGKYAKKNNVERVVKENAITAKAYDEDRLGDKNAVYCAVKGFPDYVTAVLPADFSVYKMPVFKFVIGKDAFEFIK